MTDTDKTQGQLITNKDIKDDFSSSSVTGSTKVGNSRNKQVNVKKSPLMRCFDLVEEANYSYVLGYN
ncbi:hypothetical protein [Colwellia psychrerythraea]|uniref:Uncharacterized protein n=1 Tax=Colwellia psychrerythraea TaxID=28229 RepID=A0A099KEE6_COLPS|nr:hypothetical protein [Colwellia psychrerythraea]KGJ88645.1 hypothetical protein ND2E_3943 [Colwellia psychrerythraea]